MAPLSEQVKMFECNQCSKTYKKYKGLMRHKRLDHGPVTLVLYCLCCGHYGKRRSNLRRHYVAEHPGRVSDVSTLRKEPLRSYKGPVDSPRSIDVRRVVGTSTPPSTVAAGPSSSQEAGRDSLPSLRQLPSILSPLHDSPRREDDELSLGSMHHWRPSVRTNRLMTSPNTHPLLRRMCQLMTSATF